MSDLKDFLENIRKFSPKIGEVAMRHVSMFIILLLSNKPFMTFRTKSYLTEMIMH